MTASIHKEAAVTVFITAVEHILQTEGYLGLTERKLLKQAGFDVRSHVLKKAVKDLPTLLGLYLEQTAYSKGLKEALPSAQTLAGMDRQELMAVMSRVHRANFELLQASPGIQELLLLGISKERHPLKTQFTQYREDLLAPLFEAADRILGSKAEAFRILNASILAAATGLLCHSRFNDSPFASYDMANPADREKVLAFWEKEIKLALHII